MVSRIVQLNSAWELGSLIKGGGFGEVYEAHTGDRVAALKLIPKEPGAERELLFADLGHARNVVPVIESGEFLDFWVIVMPLAKCSLRSRMEASGGLVPLPEVMSILQDMAIALIDINGQVVHRDLKPENVLLLDEHWCLADFGIARYAEASTAPDTRNIFLTPPYAAPEQWRFERAMSATDVYAFGIIGYELMTGTKPFLGPTNQDFREQHLTMNPPFQDKVPTALATLIAECLLKVPGARPSATDILARLNVMSAGSPDSKLSRLQLANQMEVGRRAETARKESIAQIEIERRDSLLTAADQVLSSISIALLDAIVVAAPSANVIKQPGAAWHLGLGSSMLSLSQNKKTSSSPWNWKAPAFDVICHASITLRIPKDRFGYEGRSHSIWYCDAVQPNHYIWYETAFMISPMIALQSQQNPFCLEPGEESAKAVWNGVAEYQVAWPFSPLVIGDLDEFINRWADWLADASTGTLTFPGTMPERSPGGSWRTS